MNLIVKKTLAVHGQITPPPSKSQSVRAIFLATLCQGESVLENILLSQDTQDAINTCKHLGANISGSDNALIIRSEGLPLQIVNTEIYSGNSGITTQFVMPLLGLRKNAARPIILNCGDQMRARPIKSLIDALKTLGLGITYLRKSDELPVSISGELRGGEASIDGITSQYLSALLLALPCAKEESEIKVKNLHERPYVEMTLNWLKDQNIQFSHASQGNIDTYKIKGKQQYKKIHSTISGDFTSASYLIAASVLIPGKVIVEGLAMSDPQGDKRLVTLLQEMGADIIVESKRLIIRGGKKLSGIKIDANDIPDLLPTLAVIGVYASGKTEIRNVEQARIKETDRIHSMADGLRRMGAKIDEHQDGLTVYQSLLLGCSVKGCNDHRTVMALSIAGMIAEGITIIEDGEAIKKTFPGFIKIMQSLGAKLEVENVIST
ncbi:MAG: 3-phosphoshikimate 1-carboxyvinyltransferase [Gammaproteobacteria bacterium]|jgi:3-phosphoshikimate 1-carboxyvinyltransferase|nr:3-phosphoshikimate 1-carboxyvinyltransferase [Gammaproteobacteria bacterium]